MAKLQDIIAGNKKRVLSRNSSGELAETSGEELQGLAQKAGLQAPPVTPLGAMAIGANPDQAKMAGSGAQKKAALSLSQAPQDNLQTVQRQQQARSQATQQETAAREKSENLKALGGLGDRVNDFINVQRQNLVTQAQAQTGIGIKANEDASLLASLPSDQVDSFKGLLEQFQQNPSNLQLLVDAGNMIGGRAITPEEVAGLYQTAQQSIAGAAGAQVADQLTVGNLFDDPDFGYDPNSLSQLLGVTPEELQGYTVAQLEEKVDQVAADEFAKSAQMEQQATSTQLGAAERQFARQAGRELSATGVRSSEADIQTLEQQIEAGQEVTFGGKQYDLETLLDDETFSQVVSDYMTNPDSPESQRLLETEPQLMEFIQKNEALFSDAVNEMKAQTTEFGAIQEENKELAQVGNTALDDEIMNAFFSDYGKLTTDRLQVDPNSALAYIKQDPKKGEIITSQLNSLMSQNPEYAEQLAGLSAQELQELGIENNSPKWRNFQDVVSVNNRLKAIEDDDIESVISAYLGIGATPQSAQQFLDENKTRSVLGLGTGNAANLDRNRDGKLDDPSAILNYMKASTPKPTLQNAIAGNVKKFQQGSLETPTLSEQGTKLYDTFAKYAKDGIISAGELNEVFTGKTSPSDIDMMNQSAQMPGVDNVGKGRLSNLILEAKSRAADAKIAEIASVGTLGNQLETLGKYISGQELLVPGKNNSFYMDMNKMKSKVSDISKQLGQELADAKARGDATKEKRANDNIVLAAKVMFPVLAAGDAVKMLGDMIGNDQLKNLGDGINKGLGNLANYSKQSYNKVTGTMANVDPTNPAGAVGQKGGSVVKTVKKWF